MATIRYGSTATGTLVIGPSQPLTPTQFNVPPTPPTPMPDPPRATITDWQPRQGVVPFVCRAVWKQTGGGPITTVQWLLDGQVVAPHNSPNDPDHHYVINTVGQHRIDLRVIGPGGTDQTGALRQVTGLAAPTPQPPDPGPGPGPGPDPGPPSQIVPVTTDGRIFRAGGAPWRWRGVSAFKLLAKWAAGEDIAPYLAAYRGYSVVRVWPYVRGGSWPPAIAWDTPDAAVARRFLAYLASQGWYAELTLLTDDGADKLEWAKAYINALAAAPRPTNLFIEAGNEPDTHKAINTAALRPMLDASGFLYSSGNYEISSKFFGRYGTAHTQRDAEWPRRAHDLMEYYNGGGPHKPSDPAHHNPWVADEPAKPQDVGGNKPDDYRAYFGTSAILGAGATFHCESAKFANLPNAEETACAAAALEGLNAFPADAPLGPYSRPADKTLRTYVVGNYMVRIRPTTNTPPVNGFTRTGASNILWRKG